MRGSQRPSAYSRLDTQSPLQQGMHKLESILYAAKITFSYKRSFSQSWPSVTEEIFNLKLCLAKEKKDMQMVLKNVTFWVTFSFGW